MTVSPVYLAWITHNRKEELIRSIENLNPKLNKQPRQYNLVVSSSGHETLGPSLHQVNKNIHIIEANNRELWIKNLQDQCAIKGINPNIISFALNPSFQKNDVGIVTTGANRNLLILALSGKKFISIDDDVLVEPIRYINEKNPQIIASSTTNPLFFKSLESNELLREEIEFGQKVSIDDFFDMHIRMLSTIHTETNNKCAASLSGYYGDSGFHSPRLIFSLEDQEILKLTSSNAFFNSSTKSRLVWRESEEEKYLEISPFMPICAGFNNEIDLPPFFPLGRNQDGAYAYAMAACLENITIGHVNCSVFHDPIEKRTYENTLDKIDIRINDLMAFIWVDIIKSAKAKNYQESSLFFNQLSTLDNRQFTNKIYQLMTSNLIARSVSLDEKCKRLKHRNTLFINEWIYLATKESEYCKWLATNPHKCIPVEATRLANEPYFALELVKTWINNYSQLLKHWSSIRQIAKTISPFDI